MKGSSTFISQRAYGLSSIMKSSVLTAVLLSEGTTQSNALELRKEALVLCFSPETQTPFMYCGGGSNQFRENIVNIRRNPSILPTFTFSLVA